MDVGRGRKNLPKPDEIFAGKLKQSTVVFDGVVVPEHVERGTLAILAKQE